MSTEPFIGEVKIFGFNFAPLGYQLCKGQLLSIAEYTALFALIGTTYGGDGQTTFALPDLEGRFPIGQGSGPGLSSFTIGESAGSPMTTLTTANIPAHVHTLFATQLRFKANSQIADSGTAVDGYPGSSGVSIWSESSSPGAYMAADAAVLSGVTDATGGSAPFGIANPYLVLNYSMAVEGIFPSHS